MTSRGAIGVLGSANMDLVVRVDAFPIVGETVSGIDFRTVPGGKGLNQAVAASRAGADVHFVGAVGDDPHGDEIRGLLQIGRASCRERVESAVGAVWCTSK